MLFGSRVDDTKKGGDIDSYIRPQACNDFSHQFVTGLQAGGIRRGGVCIPSTTRPQTLPFRAGWRVFRPEGRGFKPGRNPDKIRLLVLLERKTGEQKIDVVMATDMVQVIPA
jgi:hypothetical protein